MANHPLTAKEIVRISKILLSDAVATAQKDLIYVQLGLDLAGLADLKRRVLIDGSDSFGFFLQMLSNYKSMMGPQGTVNTLKDHFQELNLTNVVEKIGTTTCAGIWYNIPLPSHLFTGRKSELAMLHESITSDSGLATVINHISAVYGLGGIGKSELAKRYAQHNFAYFEGNGIWIDAETAESFQRSVVKLLEKHFDTSQNKSKDMNNNELMQIVYDHFHRINQKCLIIFDNVEDYDVIRLLPKSINPISQVPSILITSRKSRWMAGIKLLSLDLLSIEDAIALVNKSIETSQTEDVRRLVNTLQCLPLALQQALAYIRAELTESANPIGKYLQLFESQKIKELLNYKNEEELAENEKTTLKTWSITMKNIKVKENGALATRIMNLVSCFDADNIPVSVFEKLYFIPDNPDGSNVSSTSNSATTNELNMINTETRDNIDGAVALLKKYSMITGPPGVINIHRLVQRVVQLYPDLDIEDVLREGLVLLEHYMDFERRNDDIVKSLLPHAENIWRISMRHTDLVKPFAMFPSKVCEKLHYYGRYASMLQLAQDSKSEIITISGEACKSAIKIRHLEASAQFMLGKHTESREILEQILPISEVNLGIEHEITHLIFNMITLIETVNNGAKENKILHEKILAKQLKSNTYST